MNKLKMLAVAGLLLASTVVRAATPDAAQVKAVHDLLVAMQAEKKLRMTAGMSRYPDEKTRLAVMAKIEKVPANEVYDRLAPRIAPFVTTETALEMARFYQSSYGQKVLKQEYNSGPTLYAKDPVATPAEKAELKKPAYQKADKALKEAESQIHHQTFLLVTEIAKK